MTIQTILNHPVLDAYLKMNLIVSLLPTTLIPLGVLMAVYSTMTAKEVTLLQKGGTLAGGLQLTSLTDPLMSLYMKMFNIPQLTAMTLIPFAFILGRDMFAKVLKNYTKKSAGKSESSSKSSKSSESAVGQTGGAAGLLSNIPILETFLRVQGGAKLTPATLVPLGILGVVYHFLQGRRRPPQQQQQQQRGGSVLPAFLNTPALSHYLQMMGISALTPQTLLPFALVVSKHLFEKYVRQHAVTMQQLKSNNTATTDDEEEDDTTTMATTSETDDATATTDDATETTDDATESTVATATTDDTDDATESTVGTATTDDATESTGATGATAESTVATASDTVENSRNKRNNNNNNKKKNNNTPPTPSMDDTTITTETTATTAGTESTVESSQNKRNNNNNKNKKNNNNGPLMPPPPPPPMPNFSRKNNKKKNNTPAPSMDETETDTDMTTQDTTTSSVASGRNQLLRNITKPRTLRKVTVEPKTPNSRNQLLRNITTPRTLRKVTVEPKKNTRLVTPNSIKTQLEKLRPLSAKNLEKPPPMPANNALKRNIEKFRIN